MPRWWHIWGDPRPTLEVDERRRRRREAAVIAATALLFTVFAVIEVRLPQFSGSGSTSSNVFFFLLINLNLLLLVLLIFLVTRNLVKLVFERRRGIFGSRLRTRLVMAFVSLTLVPAALLFFVTRGFLDSVFDSWFNVRVESALRGSLDVAQDYYQFAANNAVHFARELSRQVDERGLLLPARRAELQRFADEKRAELGVASLEVFAHNRASVARAADPTLLAKGAPAPPPDLVTELFNGADVTRTQPLKKKGDIVRAGVPVRANDGRIVGAVTVEYLVPRDVGKSARDIGRSYREYRQVVGMERPIKNGYMLTLALITLVVIFSAIWFGFQQAKSLTIPLQRLAEGTREVAHGNWSYRIEAGADQETAVLVDSFNQMTAELQQINAELVERRTYVESILANIAAGVVSLSPTGTVTTLNPAADVMLGVRLLQVRGKQWTDVFHGPHLQAVGQVIGDALAAPARDVERQLKLTGGDHIVTALVTAKSLRDDAGDNRGLMLFLEDVTHLLRVQRMEAWREVARRLAHEIKNPLTPIQLSAQRLRKRYGAQLAAADGALFDECTRTIIGQVEELKRLVNEFSNFARLPAVELVPQDLNAVVEEAVVLFREGHPSIVFDVRPAAALPPVDLDREALKRALINLLDNAVAACHDSPGGGRIDIATTYVEGRGVVRLEVGDNGAGMSREVKLRLFEPYFSTKKEGTGLGLAIVSSVLADHQAYIRVQDNHPRGSRFIIDFPLRWRGATERVAARA